MNQPRAFHRPGTIDKALIGQPELRAKVEALSREFGYSLTDYVAELAKLGIVASPSAAQRFRAKLRPTRQGGIGQLAARVMAKVLTLRGPELEKLARVLGVGR